MFNSYHIFNTLRGQGGDPTTVFAAVSSNGPGGADPSKGCISEALRSVKSEAPFRMAPQSQITTIDGYDPIDTNFAAVKTGVEFDAATYQSTGASVMKLVPAGVGTAPFGVRFRLTVRPSRRELPRAQRRRRRAPFRDAAGNPENSCASQPTLTCDATTTVRRARVRPSRRWGVQHGCRPRRGCRVSPRLRAADLGQLVSSITGGTRPTAERGAARRKVLFNTAA